ncbi:MAG: hypothetical protein RIS94_484 [Pseudomonadota bacterium]|jgi:hypothetical protein
MLGGMADLLLVAMLAAWLFFVFCVWQAIRLFGGWKPASAQVWRSDYTEDQQNEDRWCLGFTSFTSRGWNWRDGEDSRLIEDEIVFTTDQGREVRTLVQRRVDRGWRPSGVYTVWYDPADPRRATVLGPFYWAAMAALSLAAMVMLARALAAAGLPPALLHLLA